MLLSYQYYEFTGKQFKHEVSYLVLKRKQVFAAAARFAKKYGAYHKAFVTSSDMNGGFTIVGFHFDQHPGGDWKKTNEPDTYRPSKKAKKLYAEFMEIPKFSLDDLAKLANYTPIFDVCKMYTFNPFWTKGGKRAGFRVPVFTAQSVKMNPLLKYKAPKGIKKISAAQYDKLWGSQ